MVNSNIGDSQRNREGGIIECMRCGELFLNQSAHDKHVKSGVCLTPQLFASVGLTRNAVGWEVSNG